MRGTLRTPLYLAAGAVTVVLGLLTVALSVFSLLYEIGQLDRSDYSERIRNFEYDYHAVDAVSAATEEVQRIQGELLDRLESRYLGFAEARAYPFIVNGDGQTILHLPESGLDDAFFSSLVTDGAITELSGAGERRDLEVRTGSFSGWVIYSYYRPWDWYTGFVMSNSTRYAGVRRLLTGLAVTVVVSAVLLFALFGSILNRLLRPVRPIERTLAAAKEGDLTGRLGVRGRTELGRIAAAIDSLLGQFGNVIDGITQGTARTVEAGHQLKRFADGALESFRSIGVDTGAIAEEIGHLGDHVEESTRRVGGIAEHVHVLAERVETEDNTIDGLVESLADMERTLAGSLERAHEARNASAALQEATHTSSESAGRSSALMRDTASRVEGINDFIDLIQSIAEQTNLLAMNAAIEASHAGEAGKGFAVVADEIRKLSTEAGDSSHSISTVLKELVVAIRQASEISSETSETFVRFEEEIGRVSGALETIAADTDRLEAQHRELVARLHNLRESSEATRTSVQSADEEAQQVRSSLSSMESLAGEVRRESDRINRQAHSSGDELDRVQALVASVTEEAEELAGRVRTFVISAADETDE